MVPLAEFRISRMLIRKPDELADIIVSPDITPEMAIRLQEVPAVLRIALDDTQLQNIPLGGLMNI